MKNIIGWITLFVLTFSALGAQNLLVGYYPSWNQNEFTASNVQWEHVTHVVHAFTWPEADGRLGYDSGFWNADLIQQAHQNGRKVLLSVGGASKSNSFSPVTADAAKRAKFVGELLAALKQYNYDGIDIDWEFPESEVDKNNMVVFISDLHTSLNNADPDYLLTMAIPSGDYYGQWFRYAVLKLYVDWFNVMTYDYHGDWFDHSGHNAPLYSSPLDGCGSVDETCTYLYETRNIEKKKMCIGLAFYGRSFNTTGLYQASTDGALTYGYKDIIGLVNNGWAYNWDDVSKVPFLNNDAGTQLITYDDTTSIRIKSNYIISEQYKGGMIWALGHDQFADNRQPLLKTAADILSVTSLPNLNQKSSIPDHINLKAYPNPFNDTIMFAYRIPANQEATIKLFDSRGKLISVLAQKGMNYSQSRLLWNARDYNSGVFFAVLQTKLGNKVCKLVHLK